METTTFIKKTALLLLIVSCTHVAVGSEKKPSRLLQALSDSQQKESPNKERRARRYATIMNESIGPATEEESTRKESLKTINTSVVRLPQLAAKKGTPSKDDTKQALRWLYGSQESRINQMKKTKKDNERKQIVVFHSQEI